MMYYISYETFKWVCTPTYFIPVIQYDYVETKKIIYHATINTYQIRHSENE